MLTLERRASIHTCDSYAYAFQLLLTFASKRLNLAPSRLQFEQIDAPLVVSFLNDLESTRSNGASSRNVRLAAIKSFKHFMEYRLPAALEQIRRILAIPMKKTDTRLVRHLSTEEVQALLDAPKPTDWSGIRDRAMLHVCFAGGLRVSELTGLRLEDLSLHLHASILIHGKGRKERCLPLWKQTASALRAWLTVRGTVQIPELFVNARREAMTRSGFEYILEKYVKVAKKHYPSLYARGMTTREIQGHLQEMYGVEVSPTLISEVTDAVSEEVKAWQSRPLEPIYGIVFLDALYVKMRHEGRVKNRAVYVAIGVDLEGRKEVLGLWTSANEGAKFWLGVLTELKNRGVRDVLIVCIDGLKGFPQAIESVFPEPRIQLCIVHLVRASLNYVNWKERRRVAADLKAIYRAATEGQAEQELTEFIGRWGDKYQAIGKLWKDNWERVIPFFEFPPDVRRVIYTTNAVESLHMSLRKIIKTRGSFPSEDAALKLLYLALRNASAKWETIQHWKEALNYFQMLWSERIQAALNR